MFFHFFLIATWLIINFVLLCLKATKWLSLQNQIMKASFVSTFFLYQSSCPLFDFYQELQMCSKILDNKIWALLLEVHLYEPFFCMPIVFPWPLIHVDRCSSNMNFLHMFQREHVTISQKYFESDHLRKVGNYFYFLIRLGKSEIFYVLKLTQPKESNKVHLVH